MLERIKYDIKRNINNNIYSLYRCICGNEKIILDNNVKRGNTKSCGCIGNRTHQSVGTKEHNSWRGMRARCLNKKSSNYPNYGGRGISICASWNSFEQFLLDMGLRPLGSTLDRIDVNGNYEPGNCRWADWKEQRANRR